MLNDSQRRVSRNGLAEASVDRSVGDHQAVRKADYNRHHLPFDRKECSRRGIFHDKRKAPLTRRFARNRVVIWAERGVVQPYGEGDTGQWLFQGGTSLEDQPVLSRRRHHDNHLVGARQDFIEIQNLVIGIGGLLSIAGRREQQKRHEEFHDETISRRSRSRQPKTSEKR